MSRVLLACFFGFFFGIATLEVDVFDYDNTFFDTYDTYTKTDNKVVQHILSIEFVRYAFPEIISYFFGDRGVASRLFSRQHHSSNYFYRPKLFLAKSSLLI